MTEEGDGVVRAVIGCAQTARQAPALAYVSWFLRFMLFLGWFVHDWFVHDWFVHDWFVHDWFVHDWFVHDWFVHGCCLGSSIRTLRHQSDTFVILPQEAVGARPVRCQNHPSSRSHLVGT